MELSLRAARKLETKIGTYLEENQVKTSVKVRVNTDPKKLETMLDDARKAVMTTFQEQAALCALRYSLRRLISAKNAVCGIDETITTKVHLENKIKQLKVMVSSDARLETEALADTLALGKKRLDQPGSDTYGHRDSPVVTAFAVLSQADLDSFKKEVSKLQREIEGLESRLDELNHSAKVELSVGAESLLRKHELL